MVLFVAPAMTVIDSHAALDTPRARASLRDLTHDPDPATRDAARRALLRAADPQTIADALRDLREGTHAERTAALDGLRLLRSLPTDLRPAVARTLGDAAPQIRLLALELLDDGQPRAALPAIAALVDDPHLPVALRALTALGNARDKRVLAVVMGRVRAANPIVARQAMLTLGRLGDPAIAPFLMHHAQSDPEALRGAAVDALGILGSAAAVPLLTKLADGGSPLAALAARALGEIRTPEAATALVALLRTAADPDAQATALVQAGPAALAPLLAELDGEYGIVSARLAALTLGRLGDARAVDPLARIVPRRDRAAMAAIEALGWFGTAQAHLHLERFTHDPAPEIRQAAKIALARK